MEEWNRDILINLLDSLIDYRGKTPKKTSSGVPLVTAKIIKGGRILPFEEFIAEDNYDSWMVRGLPQPGDVVLTTEAPLGEVAQLDNTKVALAQRVVTLRGKKGILDNTYLKYFLQSDIGQKRLIARETGTTVTGIKQSELRKVEVSYPDFDTQCRIASILKSLDDKIALNNRINHNLEDFLLSLYGRLLDSQCGSSTIGQVSERVYSGGTPDTKNSDYWGGTINWLSSGETSNHFIIDTEKRITENGVLHSSTKFASKYDVVIASAGQGNTRGQTSMTLLDTCINQSVIVIHANTYEAPIVFCSLANRYDELRAISDASSIRGSLTTKMISALEIPVFPEVETFKFASQAKCIIDQVENNLRENRSLTMMRDSLLPKLMRGGLS